MITIYDWFGYDLPLKERYRIIKEVGFDGVLLWWSEHLERGDYRKGPELVREAGLFIENIHTPFQVQDYLWLDSLDGQATVECYLHCVKDCSKFDIPTMVIHLPDDDKPFNTLGLNRIKTIAAKAEQLGINIALENLQNLNNLTFILAQVDSPRVGFCYDCAHHYRCHPDVDLLSMYSSRMMALHLHDNGGNYLHRIPFDGMLDWPAIMKKITKSGYSGSTAIEVMNWDYKDHSAEQFVHKTFERAMKLEVLR